MHSSTLIVMETTRAMANAASTAPKPIATTPPLLSSLVSLVSLLGARFEVGTTTEAIFIKGIK